MEIGGKGGKTREEEAKLTNKWMDGWINEDL